MLGFVQSFSEAAGTQVPRCTAAPRFRRSPCDAATSSDLRSQFSASFACQRTLLAFAGASLTLSGRLRQTWLRRARQESKYHLITDDKLKQIFDDLSEGSGGYIDRDDLPKAIEAVTVASGVKFSHSAVQEVFYSFGDVSREIWLKRASARVGTSFRASLLESFDKFDTDGSGTLNKSEFAAAFGVVRTRHNNMLQLDEASISALWANYDLDGDGQLTRSEYLKVAESARKSELEETLNEIFDFVDADNNGKITAAEVGMAWQSVEEKCGLRLSQDDKAIMKRIFRTVSRGEWIGGVKRLVRLKQQSKRSWMARMSLIDPNIFSGLKSVSTELLAGLTVAMIVLPSAIAYGNATGLGAASGIYSAVFLGFFAALCGSTPILISGPAGSLVLPTAAVVLRFHDPYVVGAIVCTAGLLQIACGALKLGGALSFVPGIVISAFVTGLGALIVCMQLPVLLGFAAKATVFSSLGALPYCVTHANAYATVLGLGTLGVLLKWPRSWLPKIPKSLLALVLSAAGAAAFTSMGISIPLLGAIPRGLPRLIQPSLSLAMLPVIVKAASVLAVVGIIDTLLTSLIADNMMSTFHDPNRELVGQGLGNALSGAFGGLPGAGNTVPTLVNIEQGSRSPVSGMFHAVVMLAMLLGLGPLAGYLPLSALAAVLINSGIGLIDWKILRQLWKRNLRLEDLITFIVTAGGTMFFDLFFAVAAGSTIAAWYFVAKMRRLQFTTYSPQIVETGETTLCKLQGPLTFAIAEPMLRSLMPQLAGKPKVEFDLSGVTLLGCSAVMALDQLAAKIVERGGELKVYGLKKTTEGWIYVENSSLPELALNGSPYDIKDSERKGFS
eukprot:TRINITY_DN18019_c0_g1_i1.p1 TRINITY_DN18019_c0_g1~~TRINITY_DN18019_c0_g1_i1.p1  ORF type:complete len:842 (-),score=142.34 TRINITY_DN18019_c0_g1_i1:143-2668(-)